MGEFRLRAWSTSMHIVGTQDELIDDALAITTDFVDDVDLATSRFRADSQVSRLNRLAETADVTEPISPMVRAALTAALRTAQLTDGLVTPTVGSALIAAGYDRDITQVRGRAAQPTIGTQVPSYGSIALSGLHIRMPKGTILDLGASTKAWAADVLAADLADTLGGGWLVNLGGDIAVAGPAPRADWQIGIEAAGGQILQWVSTRNQGFATSSTALRTWADIDGETQHHIIDPRTGRPAERVWQQVSCAAVNALEANAASTAAIILGHEAPTWLSRNKIPARLDAVDGRVITTDGWPTSEGSVAA